MVCTVICQRHTAAGAFIDKAALPAAYEPVRPPPIDKKNTLLAPIEIGLQLLTQNAADAAAVTLAQLPLHIHDCNGGQLVLIIAVMHFKKGVAPAFRVVHADNARRCRA